MQPAKEMKREASDLLKAAVRAYAAYGGTAAAVKIARQALRGVESKQLSVTVTSCMPNGALECASLQGTVYVPGRLVRHPAKQGDQGEAIVKRTDPPRRNLCTWRALSYAQSAGAESTGDTSWVSVTRSRRRRRGDTGQPATTDANTCQE